MKYEKINKNYTKIIVISLTLIIIIGSVLVLNITKAKYKTTVSVPIVSGTVNYSGGYDFKVMALYQQKLEDNEPVKCIGDSDDCYEEIEQMPIGDYEINTSKSYCTMDGETKDYSKLVTINGIHSIKNLNKNEKCYLYFDIIKNQTSEDVLANLNKTTCDDTPLFNKEDTDEHLKDNKTCLYKAEDNFGDTYYFRGKVKDNWIKFGTDESGIPIWWRIIRINGDGSIRIIYAGTGEDASGLISEDGYLVNTASSQISKVAFNTLSNYSKYVGYFYGEADNGNLHTSNDKPSNAYTELENWFNSNLNDEWANGAGKIDPNVGFCGDRSNSKSETSSWSEGMSDAYPSSLSGSTAVYFGAYSRLNKNKQPTYICGTRGNENNDYYTYKNSEGLESKMEELILGNRKLTYPIGLITLDEVYYAGGYSSDNRFYYLYTNEYYWTMSPCGLNSSAARMFRVNGPGSLGGRDLTNPNGLRPVINLKSSVKLSGSGLYTDPYVVKNI